MGKSHCLRITRTYWLVFRQCLIHLSQVFKVVVFKDLASWHPFAVIVNEHACDNFLRVRRHIWNKLCDSRSLFRLKIELHMRCHSKSQLLLLEYWLCRPVCWTVWNRLGEELTVRISKEVQQWACRGCYEFYVLSQARCFLGRVGIVLGFQSRRSLRPNSPSCDCSSRRSAGTLAGGTI